MTASHDPDSDATVEMHQPQTPADFGITRDIEAFDPEKTLVREDWESTAIRRVASRVAEVQNSICEDAASDRRFGWESEGLRRLAQELQRAGK